MERRHGWSVRGPWEASRHPFGVHGAHGGAVPPEVGLRLLDDWSPGAQAGSTSLEELTALAHALGLAVDPDAAHDPAMYSQLRDAVRRALRQRPMHTHVHPGTRTLHAPRKAHRTSTGGGSGGGSGGHAPTPATHTASAPHGVTAAPPPPPTVPATAPEPVVRCHLTELSLTQKKRHPSAHRVLQVVPKPVLVDKRGFEANAGFKQDVLSKLENYDALLADRAKFGSFGDFARDYLGKDNAKREAKAAKRAAMTPEEKKKSEGFIKGSFAHFSGGQAKVKAHTAFAPDCGNNHPIRVTGPHGASYPSPEASIPLANPATDTVSFRATPDVYTVQSHGCEGRTDQVRVEVFPSDQYIASFSLEKKREILDRVVDGANRLLKYTGGGKAEFIAEANAEVFLGWRTEETGWRAFYAGELSAKAFWKASLVFKVSFVAMATHVPSSLLDYIGDIGASAGVSASLEVKGALTVRRFPGSQGEGRGTDVAGSITVEGKGGIPLELYAHLGAKKILAVAATGKIEPALTMEGKAKYEDESFVLQAKAAVAEGLLTVSVMTTALWWENKKEWRFTLWDRHELFEPQTFPLYRHETDRHALVG